jgi:hypothetical protein
MIKWTPTPNFEKRITQAHLVPRIRPAFVEGLNHELQTKDRSVKRDSLPKLIRRPAWSISLAILAILIISVFAIGPQKVYAEFAKLLGFAPGIGNVDQNSPIRVLATPVSITKEGVTVSVTSAFLTTEKTYLAFGASGVPSSAYPKKETGGGGCTKAPFLLLPDGKKMIAANLMGPIPQDVNQVTLVLPCIFNTLTGTVPTDWELPLQFVPSTNGLAVTPVVELQIATAPEILSGTPTPKGGAPLHLLNVLEIGNQFVIQGEFRYGDLGKVDHDNQMKDGSIWVITNVNITDADGHKFDNLPADDIPLLTATVQNAETWNLQINKGFSPPLTITYEMEHIQPIGASQQTKFIFNVGQNPQDGDKWAVDQSFSMGGNTFRMISISYSSNSGYVFQFSSDPGTGDGWVNVGIDGFTENCGGGSGGDIKSEVFTRTFCITRQGNTKFPVGNLTGTITFQPVVTENKSFSITWSPKTNNQ